MGILDKIRRTDDGKGSPDITTDEWRDALQSDISAIIEMLEDTRFPVEVRKDLYDPYQDLAEAVDEMVSGEIKWVPPSHDPSTDEIRLTLNNLHDALDREVKIPSTQQKVNEVRDRIAALYDKIEKAQEFNYAFKEVDVKKEHGRWVQSVGIRDDVDPTELDDDGEEIFAGPRARVQLEQIPRQARDLDNYSPPVFIGTGVRGGKDATIPKETLFRHCAITGVTGYGKSTEMTNEMKQLIESGEGLCFIDPKGDDSNRLMEIIPEDRLDDVIWIEPGSSGDMVSGFNFINVGLPPDHPHIETAVSALVADLKKMLGAGEYWGPRMDRIAGNVIRAMNVYNRKNPDKPNLNLADLYYVLLDPVSRQEFSVLVQAEGIDFIEDYTDMIAEMEDDKLEPILGRMQPWIESPIARRMICFRKSEVNIPQAIENNKIIIVRMGGQPEELKQMLGMAVVRRIWANIRSRAEMAEHNRDPFYLFVDEAHNIALADNTFPKMLAEARSYRLSITIATQYLSQLPKNVVKGVRVNCDTFMSFNAGSKDEARQISAQLGLEPQSLLDESRFHIWIRTTEPGTGEMSDPYKVYIHPPFPPLRTSEEADEHIERSLERFGREKLTAEERKEGLQFYKGAGQAEIGVGQEIVRAKQDPEMPPEVVQQIKQSAIEQRRTSGGEDYEQTVEIDEESDGTEMMEKKREQALLESIFAVRVKEGKEKGEAVFVEDVKREIQDRDVDFGHVERLADFAEGRSEYIDLGRKEGKETFALTPQGLSQVFGSTGDDITGGTFGHRWLLRVSFEVFTRLGYRTTLPTQEGKELPDGIAKTPFDPTDFDMSDLSPKEVREKIDERIERLESNHPHVATLTDGNTASIEAESSTLFKPAQCLTNLRKAIDKGHHAIYVTKDATNDDRISSKNLDDPTVYWGHYIERVIHDRTSDKNGRHLPDYGDDNIILAKEIDEDGHTVYYNTTNEYRVDGDHKALRCPPDGKGVTTWLKTEDGIYAANENDVIELKNTNTEDDRDISDIAFAKFDSPDGVLEGDRTAVEAYYSYDRNEQEYVVEKGGETLRYSSSEELFDEWDTFKAPFIPEAEFPDWPTEDDYTIIVIPDPDNEKYSQPLIYDQGDVIPLYDHLGMDVPDHALIDEKDPIIDENETESEASEAEHEGESSGETTGVATDEESEADSRRGDGAESVATGKEGGDAGVGTAADESGSDGAEATGASAGGASEDFLLPDVATDEDLPETCPKCGEGEVEIADQPFAGPAPSLENLPSIYGALDEEGVLNPVASPPMVTGTIDATLVACPECSLAATVYTRETNEGAEESDGPSPNREETTEQQATVEKPSTDQEKRQSEEAVPSVEREPDSFFRED